MGHPSDRGASSLHVPDSKRDSDTKYAELLAMSGTSSTRSSHRATSAARQSRQTDLQGISISVLIGDDQQITADCPTSPKNYAFCDLGSAESTKCHYLTFQ